MATVEPVSLTIGVVALASLFSTCIECFNYFNTGRRLEEDLEILLVKLDVEKARLLIWGNGVGIFKAEDEGRAMELGDPSKTPLIERCLERIKSLLSDTKDLQGTYGVQASTESRALAAKSSAIVSVNSMNLFETSYRRFWVRFARNQTRSGVLTRTKWAIHDKPKFEGLVIHLREIIDGLNQVLPIPRETQDQIMHDDIGSILDISKLRLVRSACEGSYRGWSTVASEVIQATEAGTEDRRSVEDWLVDTEATNNMNAARGLDNGASTIITDYAFPLQDINKLDNCDISFILTAPCRNVLTDSPCELADLGKESCKVENSVLAQSSKAQWSIGRRLVENLHPAHFTSDLENAVRPVGTLYIYCAPCACLITTAIEIGKAGRNKFFAFCVRPDDRLSASCCSNLDRSLGLTSLLEAIRDYESENKFDLCALEWMDKYWLERRLFEIDEIDPLQPSTNIARSAGAILASHEARRSCAGFIFLGELDHCLPIMHCAPFPAGPRIPRETEAFQMKRTGWPGTWTRHFLGTYTAKPLPASAPASRTSTAEDRPSSMPSTSTPLHSTNAPTRHISPPPSPASKRYRSSASSSVDGGRGGRNNGYQDLGKPVKHRWNRA